MPIILVHKVISCRETFRLKRTLQWGITVKPHSLPRGLRWNLECHDQSPWEDDQKHSDTHFWEIHLRCTPWQWGCLLSRWISSWFSCFQCYECSFDLCILLKSNQFFIHSQIDHHFNEFSLTDMTIKILQKIVTCPVEASFKAKWLQWWNAPLRERLDNKFPVDKPMREKALDD